jgi:hypothetical protein
MQFKSFTQYVTEETKDLTVAWGRYNPPTIGHEKLFAAVNKVASGNSFGLCCPNMCDLIRLVWLVFGLESS